jgi:ATP-binding cassette subfamily B protein
LKEDISLGVFRPYIRKYGKAFAFAIFLLMIEATADLTLPTIMAHMIDDGVLARDMGMVSRLGGWMLMVTGIGLAATIIRNLISSQVAHRFGADLRLDLYRKIQSFSFASIDKFERPSLMTRMTNDVTQVQNFVSGMMRIFVKSPLLCIGSIIMAVNLNPHLSVVLLIVIPAVALLIALNMKIGFPMFAKVQKALDRINLTTREFLSGVRVVKAFNRSAREMEKFDQANLDYQQRALRASRVMAVFSPSVMLIMNFGIVAIIWMGGLRVNAGEMQVGHIMAFIQYMTQILFSLLMISHVFVMFVRARASAERIIEVFMENDPMAEAHPAAPVSSASGSARSGARSAYNKASSASRAAGVPKIEFDRVSFSYKGASGDPVLKDISFVCQPGETVGIIGSTGSGKSTLVSLIPRFYDVSDGAIRIDGADVRTQDPRLLREKIAIVPQKSILFTGTIENNIRWGKEDARMEEMIQAARIAQAEEFIMNFPEQYKTLLGQGGVNLSGGQKQRLSIARALIRKPEILILDDSTSAVDTATETRIKEGLKEHTRSMTCLIIAQRLTSVMDADKIIVLDDGRIAGIGRHEELLRSCRTYQEIYRSQIGEEVAANVQVN